MSNKLNNAAKEAQKMKEQKKQQQIKVGIGIAVCLVAVAAILLGNGLKNGVFTSGSTTQKEELSGAAGNAAQSGVADADDVKLLEENKTYYADIEIQDYGTITIQLDQKAAPVSAANFVSLA